MEANLTPDTAPTGAGGITQEQAAQLIEQGNAYRQELADLRAKIDAEKVAPPPSAEVLDPAKLTAAHLAEVARHDFYCPDCGRLYDYMRECAGSPESPHPPRDVVSTDELKNPPDPTDKDAYAAWQRGHTPATVVKV